MFTVPTSVPCTMLIAGDRTGKVQRRRQLILAGQPGREEKSVCQPFLDLHVNLDHVAGAYHAFEFNVVYSRDNRHRSLARGGLRMAQCQQHRSSLQGGFTENHPGNDWSIGEMALEEKLLSGELLLADDPILTRFDNLLQHQHQSFQLKNLYNLKLEEHHQL